jgi:hypothetical protein
MSLWHVGFYGSVSIACDTQRSYLFAIARRVRRLLYGQRIGGLDSDR